MKEIIAKTIDRICGVVPGDRVFRNEPMSRHTSFRIGGPAEAFIIVNNEEELAAVLAIVTETDAQHMIIGNGSNLLVSDEGYPGIMIKLGDDFESIVRNEDDPCRVKVGAAMLMSRTSAFLTENGLSGFEFASGIPGSIGGAVFMNAGAYGGEIKDVVRSVRVMDPDGTNLRTVSNEEMQFSYRHSMAEDAGILILYAEMELKKGKAQRKAAGELPERGEHLQEAGGRLRGGADRGVGTERIQGRRRGGLRKAFRLCNQYRRCQL